jgi:hypothetical protein
VDRPENPKPPGAGDSRPPLPPSLRSKMQFDDEIEEPKSNAANIIAIVMAIAIIGLGGLFFVSYQKSNAEAKTKAAAAAKAAAEQASADSVSKAEQDSVFAARQDSLKQFAPKTPPKPAAQPASTPGGGGQTAATPPPPASKFGIDVGTFLNQDRANAEQTKLQGSTGLTAKVTPVSDGGVTSYRVVLGEFSSKAEADKKANDLIVSQAIREAHVIKLKSGG